LFIIETVCLAVALNLSKGEGGRYDLVNKTNRILRYHLFIN